MTIDAHCIFCKGHAFATRAVYLHPYEPYEIEQIKKIDQKKLDVLRKEHGGWLVACYKCLAEKCPKEDVAVKPRRPDTISIQEP